EKPRSTSATPNEAKDMSKAGLDPLNKSDVKNFIGVKGIGPSEKSGVSNKGNNPGNNKADFIVSPNGTVFPVPKGATGLKPVTNSGGQVTGVAFTDGKGGANGQVSTMRIMNSTPSKGNSPGYPNGYIKYTNDSKQGVDPYSGKTLPNSKNHFGID
ncbi:hypothetical protein, partial [Leptospira alexanderi]|uniref:hypothetical protein n=1 Tax=Leptospira alexanderi TaxID=100053 RepID=UPI002014AE33